MTKKDDNRKKSVHNGNGNFSRSRFSKQPHKNYTDILKRQTSL